MKPILWMMVCGAVWSGVAVARSPVPAARTVPGVLEVKFREGQAIRLRDGKPAAAAAGMPVAALSGLQALGGVWGRSFPDVSEQVLERMRGRAASVLSVNGASAPDLNLYYRIRFPEGTEEDEAEAILKAWGAVEAVYRVPVLSLPEAPDYLNPANGSGVWQRYVDAAPDGVEARYAWSNGFNGAGVRICDVEYAWNLNHADLPGRAIWWPT